MSSNYSPLTTHVLNTATGKPAKSMQITLHRMKSDSTWEVLKEGYIHFKFSFTSQTYLDLK